MHKLIFIGVGLLFFSWFVLVERPSFVEKILIMAFVIGLYVGFRFLTGATLGEILAPLMLHPGTE
jgi:hypothetical protein